MVTADDSFLPSPRPNHCRDTLGSKAIDIQLRPYPFQWHRADPISSLFPSLRSGEVVWLKGNAHEKFAPSH